MPCVAAGADDRVDHRGVALADRAAQARRADQDLVRADAAAFLAPHQDLRDHRGERIGERAARLILLVAREAVDDAVDGLGRAVRVQRAEHEHAHARGFDRERDRLRSRISPTRMTSASWRTRRAQRGREAVAVGADLAMREHRALVLVHELDRIFDRDDVARVLAVDQVDDRGERGRLAAAGRAGDQHHARLEIGEAVHDRRHAELVDRR